MIAFAFLIGTILPSVNGWFAIRALEGKDPVLFRLERCVLGFLFGTTASMTLTFFLNVWAGLPLSRIGFLAVQIVLACVLALVMRLRTKNSRPSSAETAPSSRLPRLLLVLFVLLGLWTAAKIVTGGFLLVSLPPAYDDTVKNWNYRGKIFFTTQSVEPEYPLVGQLASYPPAVSMTKAWLAALAGTWSEGLVDSPHLLWYLATIVLLFYALRRHVSLGWSLLGAYVFTSIPLSLIHGTAAYAEGFLAAHLFAAVSLLFHGFRAQSTLSRWSFMRLAAAFIALLPITKNEGLVLYLPAVLVVGILCIFLFKKTKEMERKELRDAVLWIVIGLACTTLPLLAYKWTHQFVFGNGHALGDSAFTWSSLAFYSVMVNLFFEGSWLLLFPLCAIVLLIGWRQAFSRSFLVLTAFLLLVLSLQTALFTISTTYAVEATQQTGYSRGIVHLIPLVCFWLILMIQKMVND